MPDQTCGSIHSCDLLGNKGAAEKTSSFCFVVVGGVTEKSREGESSALSVRLVTH